MTTEIVSTTEVGLAPASPVAHVKRLEEAMVAIQEAKDRLLTEGIDYGQIPGTKKPSLYQPGSELLLKLFGYGFKYEVEESIEDWDTPFFRYQIKGIVIDGFGNTIAEGPGEANSKEPRYRRRECPQCESAVWDNRKSQSEGKFTDQPAFTCKAKCGWAGASKPSEVPEIFDFSLVNTMMKMAVKRAKVGSTLTATGGSHFFTQDVEDLPTGVDAPASTSRGSQSETGPSQSLSCPVCESSVYDNRADIDSGKKSERHPAFKCGNKECTGVTEDGEVATDGTSGEPWVTWHRHFFDAKPDGAGFDTDELKEVQGHIDTGAIGEGAVLSIARRVAKDASEDQPTSLEGIGELSADAQAKVAEAVAEKVIGGEG